MAAGKGDSADSGKGWFYDKDMKAAMYWNPGGVSSTEQYKRQRTMQTTESTGTLERPRGLLASAEPKPSTTLALTDDGADTTANEDDINHDIEDKDHGEEGAEAQESEAHEFDENPNMFRCFGGGVTTACKTMPAADSHVRTVIRVCTFKSHIIWFLDFVGIHISRERRKRRRQKTTT